jgi:hypothetical protein
MPRKRPVTPPMVKRKMNAEGVEHGRRQRDRALPQSVATQLKTFTPEGMATKKVSAEKTMVAYSLMPAT